MNREQDASTSGTLLSTLKNHIRDNLCLHFKNVDNCDGFIIETEGGRYNLVHPDVAYSSFAGPKEVTKDMVMFMDKESFNLMLDASDKNSCCFSLVEKSGYYILSIYFNKS